jgi:hypothetical protein
MARRQVEPTSAKAAASKGGHLNDDPPPSAA